MNYILQSIGYERDRLQIRNGTFVYYYDSKICYSDEISLIIAFLLEQISKAIGHNLE